jgi:hypothetical protein
VGPSQIEGPEAGSLMPGTPSPEARQERAAGLDSITRLLREWLMAVRLWLPAWP